MALEDIIEAQLLALGRQERELEERIRQHRADIRSFAWSGRQHEADALSNIVDELQRQLAQLHPRIKEVEIKLYAMRRRKRK